MQFADTVMLLTEGHLRIARVFHSDGSAAPATKHYQEALAGQPKHVLASLGLAQMQLSSSEIAAAIHTLEGLTQSPNAMSCLEANIMLASVRANPRPGVSSTEFSQDKARSRDTFEHITKVIEANEQQANDGRVSRSIRTLGEDMEMHLEIARLWQHDSTDKMARGLKEALRISQSLGISDCRIINNLAALKHTEGEWDLARSMYEDALQTASASEVSGQEDVPTTILYNLARVYEAQDEIDMAGDAYDKLLQRHPEYVDGEDSSINTALLV
jgi:RNA polymerase-associated protein CTR9